MTSATTLNLSPSLWARRNWLDWVFAALVVAGGAWALHRYNGAMDSYEKAILVGTVPVVFPVIVAAGIDPVWFGVFIVLMCEISLISPPVGMTLYVIQAVRREGTIAEVFQGTVPFFIAMVVMTALLIGFPEMALWLPRISFGP